METLGIGLYWEDLPVGRRFRTFGRTVTETDLVNFVNATGMTEVLFINTEFVETGSEIGKRFVPGALTFSFAEALLAVYSSQMTGQAFLSLELSIPLPTFVGDTIHAEAEVLESRRSRSKPHLGIVHSRINVVNQDGDTVMTYKIGRMVSARGVELA
jgi:acyl dehydratase